MCVWRGGWWVFVEEKCVPSESAFELLFGKEVRAVEVANRTLHILLCVFVCAERASERETLLVLHFFGIARTQAENMNKTSRLTSDRVFRL